MRVMKRTLLPLLLLLSLLLTACGAPPSGGEEAPWQTAYRQTGEYLLSQETPACAPPDCCPARRPPSITNPP